MSYDKKKLFWEWRFSAFLFGIMYPMDVWLYKYILRIIIVYYMLENGAV